MTVTQFHRCLLFATWCHCHDMTRYDVTSPPHTYADRRLTNRRSVPSLNSIAVGTAGNKFLRFNLSCQSGPCRSPSDLLWVSFVSIRPTIPVRSWLVCHLPKINNNWGKFASLFVVRRLKSFQLLTPWPDALPWITLETKTPAPSPIIGLYASRLPYSPKTNPL